MISLILPLHLWRSVRTALLQDRARLERKAARSASPVSARYDRERAANLTEAIAQIEFVLQGTGDAE